MSKISNLSHRFLRRPYKLYIAHDPGVGKPVIFLHGLASDSQTWRYILPLLPDQIRPICIDLTGFGMSPKPNWPDYSLSFHASQVLHTLKKLDIHQPVTIVGHSMGGLVALELAKSQPKLVKDLVLIGVPLYANKEIQTAILQYSKGTRTTNTLFSIYQKIIYDKELTLKNAQRIIKLSPKSSTFVLSEQTWVPFKKSLENAVMHQDSIHTVGRLRVPVYLYYGLFDALIIARHQTALAKKYDHILASSLAAGHMITPRAAPKIANKIIAQNIQP